MPEEILKMVEAKEVDEYGKLTKERKVTPEEWYDIYVDRIESKQAITPVKSHLPRVDFKIPHPVRQFGIFCQRNILTKLANRQYMLMAFLQAPFLALIIGFFTKYTKDLSSTATYQFAENVNQVAYMFMAIVVALFLGLMLSANEIITDRKIVERESFLRLSRLSYLHSKILVLFLITAVNMFTFVLVGNMILEIRGMLFHYWMLLFTVSCVAIMIGLNISSAFNSVVTAIIVIPIVLIPNFLFSGVMIEFDRLNHFIENHKYVPAIGEVMTSRWAYEAMAVHQFKGNQFSSEFFDIDQAKGNATYQIDHVSTLQQKLNVVGYACKKEKDLEKYSDDLILVRNELQNLTQLNLVTSFGDLEELHPALFNLSIYNMVDDSLNKVKEHFISLRSKAVIMKDIRIEEMVMEWGGEDAYAEMKRRHTNEKVEQLLLKRSQLEVEWNNQLIRKVSPIYMEPGSRFGRAHFYAPVKKLGDLSVDTFWFNLVVIWISVSIYYLALVYDLFRRITNWNRVRQLRRGK